MASTDVVTRVYDAFGRGDIQTVLELLDDEVHWHEAEGSPYQPSGQAWIGPQAVLENLFHRMGDDWTEFSVKPSRLVPSSLASLRR